VRNEFLPILALVASPLLVVAGSCVVCRRFLARIEHRTFWEPRPISEELRFTLRTIIALTIAIAALLAIGRFIRELAPVSQNLRFAIVGFTLTLTALLVTGMLVWASLGPGRPIIRVPIVVVGAAILGLLPAYSMNGPASLYLIWPSLTTLVALVTAGSLLVIRSCGYRLVSIQSNVDATEMEVVAEASA